MSSRVSRLVRVSTVLFSRRQRRSFLRRLRLVAVVFVTISSLLATQTYAYLEIEHQISAPPAPVRVGATDLTYALHSSVQMLKAAGNFLSSAFRWTDPCGSGKRDGFEMP